MAYCSEREPFENTEKQWDREIKKQTINIMMKKQSRRYDLKGCANRKYRVTKIK